MKTVSSLVITTGIFVLFSAFPESEEAVRYEKRKIIFNFTYIQEREDITQEYWKDKCAEKLKPIELYKGEPIFAYFTNKKEKKGAFSEISGHRVALIDVRQSKSSDSDYDDQYEDKRSDPDAQFDIERKKRTKEDEPAFLDGEDQKFKYSVTDPPVLPHGSEEEYKCVVIRKKGTKELIEKSPCTSKTALCAYKGTTIVLNTITEDIPESVSKGKYFLYVAPRVSTYEQLQASCIKRDGLGLAEITSVEDAKLASLVAEKIKLVFIGLRKVNNNYVHADGTSPSYMKWDTNQPKQAYRCVMLKENRARNGFFLVSTVCEMRSALCQRQANECKGKNPCPRGQICTDTTIGYNCSCTTGFKKENNQCVDVDECAVANAENNTICHKRSDCKNTQGSFTCQCKAPLWKGNGKLPSRCSLVNACPAKNKCNKPNMLCIVSLKGLLCYCEDGYHGIDDANTTCVLPNVCKGGSTCPLQSICRKGDNSNYNCEALSGYVCDKTQCEDINECKKSPCDSNAQCTNKPGSFSCVCKMPYWKGNGLLPKRCEPTADNKCVLVPNACDAKTSTCRNTGGGKFTCDCKDGFHKITENSKCFVSRICLKGNFTCPEHSICRNKGTDDYDCKPNEGYRCDLYKCYDINECKEGKSPCDSNADCNNKDGSFSCDCKMPYWTRNGTSPNNCKPTGANKCVTSSNRCDKKTQNCKNVVNGTGIECDCKDGYHRPRKTSPCVPLHKCFSGGHTCPEHSTCKNKDDWYDCTAHSGYECDRYKCLDIDECNLKKSPCDSNADCKNTDGSFSCVCKSPYWTVISILPNRCGPTTANKCARSPTRCNSMPNTECKNVARGTECVCKDGYHQSAKASQCVPIRQCLIGNFTCPEHSTCKDKSDWYDCEPEPGYHECTRDSCKDIDECKSGNKPCPPNAKCVNTEGSYKCECVAPYWQKQGILSEKCTATIANKCARSTSKKCINKPNTDCKNEAGGRFRCVCKDGYHGFATKTTPCVLLQKCRWGDAICPKHSICQNLRDKKYNCEPLPGYTCEKHKCQDIDECKTQKSPCDSNADCNNKDGSFSCDCKMPYWTRNGTSPNKCEPTGANRCGTPFDTCNKTTQNCKNVRNGIECDCKERGLPLFCRSSTLPVSLNLVMSFTTLHCA